MIPVLRLVSSILKDGALIPISQPSYQRGTSSSTKKVSAFRVAKWGVSQRRNRIICYIS
jgi:hypothetical protein